MYAAAAPNNKQTRSARGYKRRGMLAAIAAAASLAIIPASAGAQTLSDVTLDTFTSGYSMVLDVSGASREIGAPVIQWYYNAGTNQRWDLQPDNNGFEHIINVNSGLCLATNGVPGNDITQWPCSDSTQEDWGGSPVRSGTTFFGGSGLLSRSGLWLNVSGGSSSAGAPLIAWYAATGSDGFAEIFEYTQ